MSDNLWLRKLAQVNREEQEDERDRLDERWDRLSRGELTPEEDAELRALAETSEEARAAYEAFRPLGPEFHASIVQKIREQQAIRKQDPEPVPKVLPFRRRAAGWSAVAALAAAASVVILLRPHAQLPDYSLEVTKNVRELRGEESAESLVLAPGDDFTVYVRPATAVPSGSKLEALCFLARDGELRPLDVRSEIVPEGTVMMEVSLDRDLPPGPWTLWAVVGRRGKLPDPAALQTSAAGSGVRQRDWVAVLKNVRIQLQSP